MEGNLVLVGILIVALVALIYPGIYNSRTHIKYNKGSLKENAAIVDIETKPVGLKGERKFRTTVLFSDGFKYISHDTVREDHFLTYTISVNEIMKKEIIIEAIKAHSEVTGTKLADAFKIQEESLGIALRNDNYICGVCRNKGPYEGDCPQCGSSLKKYL